MYPVSKEWSEANKSFLAPEGLIEISCYIPQLNDTLVYTKKDLLSFTHQQTVSLLSSELPKNHIEFTLDNSDSKWNPSNPRGLEHFLYERLQVRLRYGYSFDGVEEWIPGGVFYLSEWRTSQNGLEASFVARDLLEYMIDKPYTGAISGTLYDVAKRAIAEAEFSLSAVLGEYVLGSAGLGAVLLSEELKKYDVGAVKQDGTETIAVVLQKCANAARCVMYQNRGGTLVIDKLVCGEPVYTVPKKLSYSYPEIEVSRLMRNLSVTYSGEQVYEHPFANSGATQTLTNDFISTESQARAVAKWTCDNLMSRQKISGDFRGDPRFDVFDVVDVESKHGTITGVVVTDIKHTFSGAFRTTYSGYVLASKARVTVYSGEVYSGEVI